MKNVLLVEDETPIRTAIESVLLMIPGVAVRSFANGAEALAAIESDPRQEISLVITDMRMPLCGGLQLARALRARGIGSPILFMSGSFDSETIAQVSQISSLWIAKPFELRVFREIVSRAIA